VRRSSGIERPRLDRLALDAPTRGRLQLHYSDLNDLTTLRRILVKTQPDEVYHLAGQTHVGISFEIPESTCDFTAMGTLHLLELLRDLPKRPRLLTVGSSEQFGSPATSPQNEQTPFSPVTPYGVAKTFAIQMARVYRDSFGMFIANAICFNHESPRRGESFVTRKITRAVAAIQAGTQKTVRLGNLEARRDWGFAGDYIRAMWMMLQQEKPDDFVIATGESHSVRDFLDVAFESVGLNWQDHVEIDPAYLRPADSTLLVGDPSKARTTLGWNQSVSFPDLVRLMVDHDCRSLSAQRG
jgi:GDPmannose 4,6-dehydratase